MVRVVCLRVSSACDRSMTAPIIQGAQLRVELATASSIPYTRRNAEVKMSNLSAASEVRFSLRWGSSGALLTENARTCEIQAYDTVQMKSPQMVAGKSGAPHPPQKTNKLAHIIYSHYTLSNAAFYCCPCSANKQQCACFTSNNLNAKASSDLQCVTRHIGSIR
jgi:hypothetical protein